MTTVVTVFPQCRLQKKTTIYKNYITKLQTL